MTGGDRVPRLTPGELDDGQRGIYDHITRGKRSTFAQLFESVDEAGCLNGPFNALLHIPVVGDAISRLGEAIRYQTQLTDRVREIVILAVAAYHQDEFEWYAHDAIASHIGISDSDIESIRNRIEPNFEEACEAAAYRLAIATAAGAGVGEIVWDEAVAELGLSQAVEVTAVVGYYTMLSLMMTAHEIRLPEGVPPAFEV